MKTVMAMMKTTPAAAEPMMRGSFSWILELYSSTGQKTENQEMGLILKYGLTPWLDYLLGSP